MPDKIRYDKDKDKYREESREYRQNNKERCSKRDAEYYQDNKDDIKDRRLRYYYNNRESILSKQQEIKLFVITHYGNGKCACVDCGETCLDCLTVDHINDTNIAKNKV